MNSIPDPKQTNPHEVAVAAIKEAYEQIGRSEEQLARVNEQVSKLEQDAAPHPSDPQQAYEEQLARVDEQVSKLEQDGAPHPSDPQQAYEEQLARVDEQVSELEQDGAPHPSDPQHAFKHDAARHPSDHPQTDMNRSRPAVPRNPSLGGQAVRAFMALILAACIGVAAIAWQSPSYRDAARRIIASWTPQLVPILSLIENPGLPAHPSPPTIQAGPPNTAPPEPASLAETAPEGVAAPTAAALSPELTQLLESTARDLATMGQEIEQLKPARNK
jgi:exonuclease VII small subunit